MLSRICGCLHLDHKPDTQMVVTMTRRLGGSLMALSSSFLDVMLHNCRIKLLITLMAAGNQYPRSHTESHLSANGDHLAYCMYPLPPTTISSGGR